MQKSILQENLAIAKVILQKSIAVKLIKKVTNLNQATIEELKSKPITSSRFAVGDISFG